jgi:hypothetical protein
MFISSRSVPVAPVSKVKTAPNLSTIQQTLPTVREADIAGLAFQQVDLGARHK